MSNKYPEFADKNPFIVSIPKITKTFKMREKVNASIVTRTQIPIRLNTAITIHRSQRRTHLIRVIDLSKATKDGMSFSEVWGGVVDNRL